MHMSTSFKLISAILFLFVSCLVAWWGNRLQIFHIISKSYVKGFNDFGRLESMCAMIAYMAYNYAYILAVEAVKNME